MRRGLLLRLGALACTLGPGACAPTRTQVVVVIDSDVPRTDMDKYRILVFGSDDDLEAVTDRTYPIQDEPPFTLPASFGVGPLGGDERRMVRIVVQGLLTALEDPETNPFGEMGIETRAVTGFVEGEARRLDMPLEAICSGVECPGSETCRAAGCEPEEVDVRSLPRWHAPGD